MGLGIYSRVRRVFDPSWNAAAPPTVFDGEHSKRWWATRDEQEGSSAATYWEGRDAPARREIGRAIAPLLAESVLEVGCHVGANLYAAAKAKPDLLRVAGVDVSEHVLAFAREHLPPSSSVPVELRRGEATSLPFPDNSFDVVLTSVTLCCVGPDEIERALAEIVRVARRVVLAEPLEQSAQYATPEGRPDYYPNTTYWIRDYAGMLRDRADVVSVVKLPPDHALGHLDSIMTLRVK